MKEIYGVSRNRDKKGKVVKRNLNPYVNCIHTLTGGGKRQYGGLCNGSGI